MKIFRVLRDGFDQILDWTSLMTGLRQVPKQMIFGKSMKSTGATIIGKLYEVMLLVTYMSLTSIILIGVMPLVLCFLLASLVTLSLATLLDRVSRVISFLMDRIHDLTFGWGISKTNQKKIQ